MLAEGSVQEEIDDKVAHFIGHQPFNNVLFFVLFYSLLCLVSLALCVSVHADIIKTGYIVEWGFMLNQYLN